MYGLSAPLAAYLASSADILHRFANEDVTVGAWLLGLEVQHVHDTRFCCEGRDDCFNQVRHDLRMNQMIASGPLAHLYL